MNIQKIFQAVEEDEMNSPLISVVWELKRQGYQVKLEGLEVTMSDMGSDLFNDLERATYEFEMELLRGTESVQKFKLVFTGYHEFCFQALNFA